MFLNRIQIIERRYEEKIKIASIPFREGRLRAAKPPEPG